MTDLYQWQDAFEDATGDTDNGTTPMTEHNTHEDHQTTQQTGDQEHQQDSTNTADADSHLQGEGETPHAPDVYEEETEQVKRDTHPHSDTEQVEMDTHPHSETEQVDMDTNSHSNTDQVEMDTHPHSNAVNDQAAEDATLVQTVQDATPNLPPPVPTRNSTTSLQEPMKGLSGNLPSVNYPPPPPPPETKPPSHPPTQVRKVSSPFTWFSRAKSTKPTSPTRPDHARTNTTSSMHTIASNSDHPTDARDRSPARPHRDSLKDRFQLLRLQGELPASTLPDQDPGATRERLRSGSIATVDSDASRNPSLSHVAPAASIPAVSSPTTEKLPPGTAAGPLAGPAEDNTPVNWDLWQSVVYEGPTAVSRTSGQELSQAIANGIPQPIRGVVWQVLAGSKNPHLEIMYRELVSRGTDKEVDYPPPIPRTTSATNVEKESLASSASSIKSDVSTPATAVSPSPSHEYPGAESSLDKKRRSGDDKAAVQKLEKVIKRDLGARTSYSKYLASAGLQDGLFGLCKAYALFDEAVGYAQGMNFIAMPLLFNMPEEEAFTLFVRLMSKYNLRSMFTAEMTGLHLHLYQFERLLEDFEPALYCHLHRRGVAPDLYATQWFLTLFAYRFPLQLVLRVYDLILSEGLSAILKFGIALMQKNAHTLLQIQDMSQLATYLKEKLFDVYIDKSPSALSILESGFFGSAGGIDKEVYRADDLVRDACAVIITPQTLAAYTAEFEERRRLDKEREAEVEGLRSSNSALTTRVRRLEERAQQHDTEHVGIASELVRTKVDNETLHDENEGLKTQVAELKKVVDAQPAEVEEKLRAEMDRIMQRNIEVQNQNRALEESVQETEQELVGTKMMFAQVSEALQERICCKMDCKADIQPAQCRARIPQAEASQHSDSASRRQIIAWPGYACTVHESMGLVTFGIESLGTGAHLDDKWTNLLLDRIHYFIARPHSYCDTELDARAAR